MTIILKGKSVNRAREVVDGNLEDLLRKWVADGMTARDIGAIVNIPGITVQAWLHKLGIARSPSEAQAVAWQKGRFDREAHRQRAYDSGFHKASTGRPCPWRDKDLPEEWRDNISEGMTGTRVGKNHPLWKGGAEKRYGTGWKRAKRITLRRADGQCESCGKTPEELGRPLDVHHKIPVRYFTVPSDAHSLSNLIALCRPCHVKAERAGYESMPLFQSVNSKW